MIPDFEEWLDSLTDEEKLKLKKALDEAEKRPPSKVKGRQLPSWKEKKEKERLDQLEKERLDRIPPSQALIFTHDDGDPDLYKR